MNPIQLCGMLAVAFGLIYVIFNPGTLPFTIGFSISETKGIAMFGLIGTVFQWGYGKVRQKLAGRQTINVSKGV